MAKRKTIIVKLQSEASDYFYTTRKNPKMAHKLELRKFDPIIHAYAVFKEKKIK